MGQLVAVNARIDEDLMERLRNAVWHIGRGMTINALVEEALAVICEKLENKYNGGKPFPARKTELPKSKKKSAKKHDRK